MSHITFFLLKHIYLQYNERKSKWSYKAIKLMNRSTDSRDVSNKS